LRFWRALQAIDLLGRGLGFGGPAIAVSGCAVFKLVLLELRAVLCQM
jgi:hypothetical protein